MSFELNFNNAEVQESVARDQDPNKPKIMHPGIYLVKTTEVKAGVVNNEKQTPYIDWTVTNDKGEILTNRYFTSTTVKSGSTQSAWDISSSSILQLITAINGLDKDTAKAKLNELAASSDSNDSFVSKLSVLVVGKSFKLKVNGTETPIGTEGKTFVKSSFGSYTFAVPTTTEDVKLGKPYIKQLPKSTVTTSTTTSDLPF
jgi:hypothetical protein